MSSSLRQAKEAFALAMHELVEEPTSASVVRYLVASRNLEHARRDAHRAVRVVAGPRRLAAEGAA